MHIQGFYTLISGDRLAHFRDPGPIKNRITAKGLDALSVGFTNLRFHLGSTPFSHSSTQTKLTDPLTMRGGSSPEVTAVNTKEGDFWRTRLTATFPAGSLQGDIGEVGFNNLIGGLSQDMFSLAKIKDQEGNNTLFDVLADEPLTVVWDGYVKPSTLSKRGEVSIRGALRSYTLEAIDPDNEYWALTHGRAPSAGRIEDTTGALRGTLNSMGKTTYLQGTFQQGIYFKIPAGESEEIKALHFYDGGYYRLEFDDAFTKEANEEIEFGSADEPFMVFNWNRETNPTAPREIDPLGDSYILVPLTADSETLAGDPLDDPNASFTSAKGMVGDGIRSHYLLSNLPNWVTGDELYLQATAEVDAATRNAFDGVDKIVSVGGSLDKLGLVVYNDDTAEVWPIVGFRGANQSALYEDHHIARPSWSYQFRFPELERGGFTVSPQAIDIDVDGTILVSGHYNGTENAIYRLDQEANVLSFYRTTVGDERSNLISVMDRDSSGRLWVIDYDQDLLLRVDEPASESTGFLVHDISYSVTAVNDPGGIAFYTIDDVEYILLGRWTTTVGNGRLYLMPLSDITDGGAFSVAGVTQQVTVDIQMEGIAVHDDLLYIACNSRDGGGTEGYILVHELTGILDRTPSSYLPLFRVLPAATAKPEDIAFDAEGNLFMATEGLYAKADSEPHIGVWKRANPLGSTPVTYGLHYNAGNLAIYIDNRLFTNLNFTTNGHVGKIEIGGPEQSGFSQGHFVGFVKDVFLSDTKPSDRGYDRITGGLDEVRIGHVSLPLPESKNVDDWTNEVGAIEVDSELSRAAPSRIYYTGADGASFTAYQDVPLRGIDMGDLGLLDTPETDDDMWVTVSWQQSSANGSDGGTMGLAFVVDDVEVERRFDTSFPVGLLGEWYGRKFTARVPAGCDNVRLIMTGTRGEGTPLDLYIDDIKLDLSYRNARYYQQ